MSTAATGASGDGMATNPVPLPGDGSGHSDSVEVTASDAETGRQEPEQNEGGGWWGFMRNAVRLVGPVVGRRLLLSALVAVSNGFCAFSALFWCVFGVPAQLRPGSVAVSVLPAVVCRRFEAFGWRGCSFYTLTPSRSACMWWCLCKFRRKRPRFGGDPACSTHTRCCDARGGGQSVTVSFCCTRSRGWTWCVCVCCMCTQTEAVITVAKKDLG